LFNKAKKYEYIFENVNIKRRGEEVYWHVGFLDEKRTDTLPEF